jgi:hypothetical protein
MKVSTDIDNNFGYENITQLVDIIPLSLITVYNTFIVHELLPFFSWREIHRNQIYPVFYGTQQCVNV